MPDAPNWPHYELPSAELAAWLDQQGDDCWWNVDGDPLLMGRVLFPCRSGKLAAELRKLDRPLFIRAKGTEATGQPIGRERINTLVGHLYDNIHAGGGEYPPWANDRLLDLRWKSSPVEWMLIEDSVTAAEERAVRPAEAR